MSAVGIICEYNPFHEGHKYHIQKAREYTGADVVVAVMNGDFVQRGGPAIVDKYTRAKMALAAGVDLVFELPVRYGISSAEDFAYGGILALKSLSFVDSYCFGSESADVAELERAAKFFAEEKEYTEDGSRSDKNTNIIEYRRRLAELMGEGVSYPAARERAYMESAGGGMAAGVSSFDLSAPNHILGVEYIKAAVLLNSRMKPAVVRRAGMGYHDIHMQDSTQSEADGKNFLSASAIREKLRHGGGAGIIESDAGTGIPEEAKDIFREASCYLDSEHFWSACSYAIRNRWEELERMKDISEEIASRFRKNWHEAVSFDDFINRCKTKQITMARIRRCVFQVLLGVEKMEGREQRFPYIRLLGMRQDAARYLSRVKDTVIVGRLSKDSELLTEENRCRLEQDIRAADIYRSTAMYVSGKRMPSEYKRPVIVV